MTRWQALAEALADDLERAGKLGSREWREAIVKVPRHHFVPEFYRQDNAGRWGRFTDIEAVYQNKALITSLDGTGGVLSSSSQPGLMTRMLESLDVRDGHRVLEIGTGTGYNAALLSERLGDEHVFSVDVETELVNTARARLAELGYRPTLVAADGITGLPGHAPFDRIIATCAVPRIPWAWIDQLEPGGVLLTDLKPAPGAGNLVRLAKVGPDLARGRFDPTYAAFMDLRSGPQRPVEPVNRTGGRTRPTALDPSTPWNSLIVWFLAGFALGPAISYGFTATGAVVLSTSDGSWAEVGDGEAREGGPRDLWRLVEAADAEWRRLGEPGWAEFELTVTPEAQVIRCGGESGVSKRLTRPVETPDTVC